MSKSSREALNAIREIGLPEDVTNHIAEQHIPTYDWMPVKFENWLSLEEEEFANKSESYSTTLLDLLMSEFESHFNHPPSEDRTRNLFTAKQDVEFYEGRVMFEQLKINMNNKNIVHKLKALFESNLSPKKNTLYMDGFGQLKRQVRRWYDMSDDNWTFVKRAEDAAGKDQGRLIFGFQDALCIEMLQRDYTRFALFCEELGQVRAKGANIKQLPCMTSDFPKDCHPAWHFHGGEHSFMHTYLDKLVATDWDALCNDRVTRREVMGDVIEELEQMVAKSIDPSNVRLLISFDS